MNEIFKFKVACVVNIIFFFHGLILLCSLLINAYKSVLEIFLLSLDLELFVKIKKDLVSTHSCFTFLLITQDINKIKKNPEQVFVDIVK